jgi:hypothetical protein
MYNIKASRISPNVMMMVVCMVFAPLQVCAATRFTAIPLGANLLANGVAAVLV